MITECDLIPSYNLLITVATIGMTISLKFMMYDFANFHVEMEGNYLEDPQK